MSECETARAEPEVLVGDVQNVGPLTLIARSSSIDFPSAIAWGQWCREVAQAALDEDDCLLEELDAEARAGREAAEEEGT
jgi:hypothetical protein